MKKDQELRKTFVDLLASCDEALKNNPNNVVFLLARGILHNLLDRDREAVIDFAQVLEIEGQSTNGTAYMLKGHSHFKLKEYSLAKQYYLRGLKAQRPEDSSHLSEELIMAAEVQDEEDIADMQKVLEYERDKALVNVFSSDK